MEISAFKWQNTGHLSLFSSVIINILLSLPELVETKQKYTLG
jgi:hypothetical protein